MFTLMSLLQPHGEPDLYDLLFPPGGKLAYCLNLARRCGGPVLDLACGTGQYIVPMSEGGIRTVGLDLPADMLNGARRRAAAVAAGGARASFVLDDMRNGATFPSAQIRCAGAPIGPGANRSWTERPTSSAAPPSARWTRAGRPAPS